MANWRDILTKVAYNADEQFDKLKNELWERLHPDAPITILPYIGYASTAKVYLKGRVLRKYAVGEGLDNDSVWKNLLNTFRRFNSHEIPYVTIRAIFEGREQELVTNKEGFFVAEFDIHEPLPEYKQWREVHLELVDYEQEATAIGKVIFPPKNTEFAVISDLDDTVLQSHVANLIKMARIVFLGNAHTRLPFAGVAEFYRALVRGVNDTLNPIFYVSKSPWNLFDLIVHFFHVRNIPLGPLFLTDLGFAENYIFSPSGFDHKGDAIDRLLETYPDIPFILIGDKSEKDAVIYAEATHRHPNRIPVIYIRDVESDVTDEALETARVHAQEGGADLILVKDTYQAALDAVQRGFILEEALPDIQREKAEDESKPDVTEALLDEVNPTT